MYTIDWTFFLVNTALGVIMISRLYAMHQRSRNILVFLIVIFMAIEIAVVVINGMIQKDGLMQISPPVAEEYVLSGIHLCGYNLPADTQFLTEMTWILGTAWEILTLCLAVWAAVQHFRELQRPGWAVGDCFVVLINTHVFYFASFFAVSCIHLIYDLTPKIAELPPTGYAFCVGILSIASTVQMAVLGPRLILGLREYHAKLVANSDEGTAMTSIAFQERVHITTGSGV